MILKKIVHKAPLRHSGWPRLDSVQQRWMLRQSS